MNKYAVVYEPTSTGFSAYAPDLPGCIAAGKSLDETRQLMHEAIHFHIAAMVEDGDPVPEPSHVAEMVEAA